MARRGLVAVAAVAGLAAALVLVASGCGASAAGVAAAPATTTTAAGRPGPGSATFRACLAKHGVTLTGRPPRNGTPPNGQRPALTAKQRAAFQACGATRPNGARTKANNVLQKYTQCLSRHGVTFGKTSSTSAKYKAADKACKKYLP